MDADTNIKEIEIAGEQDYKNISKFINKNINNPYNQVAVNIPSFYSVVSIRERQFNNLEYNFLTYENSEIISDITIGVPMAGSIFSALSINSAFFRKDMDENQVRQACEKTLKFVQDKFKDKFNKIRFSAKIGRASCRERV